AREVDEVRSRLAWSHDHEVDLRTPAAEANRRLVQPAPEHGLDRWQPAERVDDVVRGVRLGEEVEVADRLLATPVGAGRDDPLDVEHAQQSVADLVDQDLGLVQEQPTLAPLEPGDALEDQELGLVGEALEVANPVRFRGDAELVDGLDAELAVDQP